MPSLRNTEKKLPSKKINYKGKLKKLGYTDASRIVEKDCKRDRGAEEDEKVTEERCKETGGGQRSNRGTTYGIKPKMNEVKRRT